ncbi:predicted protein [Uncinocarpus reesii 1704]|uniref:Uncharacterized protein n=1 Tax=Uncinocarpus reesii (strain UAMH 1704) TaxID=336963 RepID=C4JKJ5_UNCRE|nr:uncharacterized protein UREG_02152 [Uncinocarpus reesii 1704]EEP77303.1 predicted protein [Uncinocarpus reesii 1704]
MPSAGIVDDPGSTYQIAAGCSADFEKSLLSAFAACLSKEQYKGWLRLSQLPHANDELENMGRLRYRVPLEHHVVNQSDGLMDRIESATVLPSESRQANTWRPIAINATMRDMG